MAMKFFPPRMWSILCVVASRICGYNALTFRPPLKLCPFSVSKLPVPTIRPQNLAIMALSSEAGEPLEDDVMRFQVESSRNTNPIVEWNLDEDSSTLIPDEEIDIKTRALVLLDCLTCPRDPEDPEYDVEKDLKRDEIMLANDYEYLKLQLRARGLRKSGDKLEMMVRLLLNIIDPSIQYTESTGQEPNLSYISKEDLETKNVRVTTPEERINAEDSDPGPDAEDLIVLRKRKLVMAPSGGTGNSGKKPKYVDNSRHKLLMDGLNRREIEFTPQRLRRNHATAEEEDRDAVLRAYVVGGRDVLRTWERNAPVCVLLPDHLGWKAKQVRIYADEVAFYHQAIVLVPDIHRGETPDPSYPQRCSARIFDDTAAAMKYALKQYDTRSISLAGLGSGAGAALEAACDLTDIASLMAVVGGSKDTKDESKDSGSGDTGRKGTPRWSLQKMKQRRALNLGDDRPMDAAYTNAVSKPASTTLKGTLTSQLRSDSEPDYDDIELTSALRAKANNLLGNAPTISANELLDMIPTALFACCPSNFDIAKVGSALSTPSFLVYGRSDSSPGGRFSDAEELSRMLARRSNEIFDYSFRIYEDRNAGFAHDAKSDGDRRCAQEAITMGAFWLDIFSRSSNDDVTDGAGDVKATDAFVEVQLTDLMEVQPSPVATYLHEEGVDLF